MPLSVEQDQCWENGVRMQVPGTTNFLHCGHPQLKMIGARQVYIASKPGDVAHLFLPHFISFSAFVLSMEMMQNIVIMFSLQVFCMVTRGERNSGPDLWRAGSVPATQRSPVSDRVTPETRRDYLDPANYHLEGL